MSIRSRPRGAVAALLLALALAPSAAAQQGPELFRDGLERYRTGDYTGAQRALREYVEAYGDRGGASAEHLGEAYHYLGLMTPDARLAEGYFLAVAQRYPSVPVADESLARLAQLYAVRGDHAEARAQWQALARSYPLSRYLPEVDLRVGQAWFAQGDLASAFDAFTRGFSRMKEYQRSGGQGANLRELEGDYVYWLGRTLLERGAEDDARKYLNLVLLDYPGHPLEPLALYHLAEIYRAEGKEAEARDAWRRFGETVRNTSLESVSENPNLVAVARARESGDLDRRREDAPPTDETAPPDDAGADEADVEAGAPDELATAPAPEAADDAPAAGDDEQALRAPQPGRAGGVVAAEPLGRRVEPAETAETAEAEDPEAEEPDAEADLEADARRAAEEAQARVDAEAEEARRLAEEEERRREEEEEALRASREAEARRAAEEAEARERAEETEAEQAAEDAEVLRAVEEARARDAADGDETADAAGVPDGEREAEEAAREAPVLEQGRAAAGGQTPAPEAPPDEIPDDHLEPIPPGTVFLQVGAFSSAESASRLSSQLRRAGFEPSLHSGLVNGQGYYRVRFGPYEVPSERSILESIRNALARRGFEAVVMRDERGE